MRDFLTVFSYTFYENARKKAFIISTIIVLALVIILLNVPAAMKYFENNKKSGGEQAPATEKKGIVYVVDTKNVLKGNLDEFKKQLNAYDFKSATEDQVGSLKEQIKTGNNTSLAVIDEKGGVPDFNYWVKQRGNGLNPEEFRRILKSGFSNRILKDANVPDETAKIALSDVTFGMNELGKGMVKSYFSSMLIIMLLFFAVYFYGYGVSMSVASEKTSRVMEILLTSTKPSRVILGKSAAMGLLGLSQLFLIVAAATVTYKISFPEEFTIGGQSIDFSSFTPFSIIMIMVYFILGYSLYAMLNAVAGATVSKIEDLNSSMMPISIVTLLSFYLSYGSVGVPDGGLAIASSIVPFSAPFSMPSRLLMTEVPVWQILVSLLSLCVTTVFMAWISIKLYASAVLHYGKRLKIAELLKMSKNQ